MDLIGLSEVRRPSNNEIFGRVFSCYCLNMNDGSHSMEVWQNFTEVNETSLKSPTNKRTLMIRKQVNK